MKAANLVKSVRTTFRKHSPEILTGVGVAGMIATTVMAVQATPKAVMLVNEKEVELNVDKLSKKEIVKTTWKCYIPAAITGVMSVACIVGASSVNMRRNAALATAYTLSETALKEYKDKVVATIGEKKEESIRSAIAQDKIDRDPVSRSSVIITSKGDTLCYDSISGRYFRSDVESIKRAVNEMNRRMIYDGRISLNEFYYELGLDGIKIGDDLGWHPDKGFIDIRFLAQLTEDDTPCLVLEYVIAPGYEY